MAPMFFKNKDGKKRLERWFGRQCFKLIMLATRPLTINTARFLGRITGNLAFCVLLRHRRQAIHNINLVYGRKKSRPELQELIRKTFVHASTFGWETLYLYTHLTTDQQISDLVTKVEGLKHLQQALGRGKGVIAIGAHLGNFPLLGRKLDFLGFPSTTIIRQMRDEKLETIFVTMRTNFKQRWIAKFPVSNAIKECIAWLKQGNLLMIYIDQRSGRGIQADFMGLPTPTPTGAAVFALKTNAAVVPIVNVWDKDATYKLIIGEEIAVTKTGNQKQDIQENTERFNRAIEKYIWLYPDQWFWFHNRWKGVKANEA